MPSEETYCGWTEEEIEDAEFVPTHVMVNYMNDESDQSIAKEEARITAMCDDDE